MPLADISSETGIARGKVDQFPLMDGSKRAMKPDDDLSLEEPLLLDPTRDDPELLFGYDPTGEIFPLDPNDIRAKKTIDICHLNRKRLRVARQSIYKDIIFLVNIDGLTDPQKEHIFARFQNSENQYAGVVRFLFKNRAIWGG